MAINTFEVAAVMKVVDEATRPLRRVLAVVNELNESLKIARNYLEKLGLIGLGKLAAESETMAAAWGKIAKDAEAASIAMSRIAKTVPRNVAGIPAAAEATNRGRFRQWLHGGNASIGVPMGAAHSHIHGSNLAMGTAGLGIFGLVEETYFEDIMTQMHIHLRDQFSGANTLRMRKMFQEAAEKTGFSPREVGKAALEEARMLGEMPAEERLRLLPQFLEGAAVESRMKGTDLRESMIAILGQAHQLKAYKPEEIAKLMPAFSFLSTLDPKSLTSMERAWSYSVPLMSEAGVDPLQAMMLGTALSTAGATSTKSGTWLREMMVRMLPGSAGYKRHLEQLKEMGLVGADNMPKYLTEGKFDPVKALTMAGDALSKLEPTRRLALERDWLGAQGAGGFALLSNPKVRERLHKMEEAEADYVREFPNILRNYTEHSPLMKIRTQMQELNTVLMDLAQVALPAVITSFRALTGTVRSLTGYGGENKRSMFDAILGGAELAGGAGMIGGSMVGGWKGGLIGGAVAGVAGAVFGAVNHLFPLTDTISNLTKDAPAAAGALGRLIDRLRELIGLGAAGGAAGEAKPKPQSYLQGPPGKEGGAQIATVNLSGQAVGEIIMRYVTDRLGEAPESGPYPTGVTTAELPGLYGVS